MLCVISMASIGILILLNSIMLQNEKVCSQSTSPWATLYETKCSLLYGNTQNTVCLLDLQKQKNANIL